MAEQRMEAKQEGHYESKRGLVPKMRREPEGERERNRGRRRPSCIHSSRGEGGSTLKIGPYLLGFCSRGSRAVTKNRAEAAVSAVEPIPSRAALSRSTHDDLCNWLMILCSPSQHPPTHTIEAVSLFASSGRDWWDADGAHRQNADTVCRS